jgi:hypothetical protein
VKIEQLERPSDLRKHVTLDPAPSSDKKWLDPGVSFF